MSVVGDPLQPTLFERSRPGRGGGKIPHPPKDALDRLPQSARREAPPALPELNEPEVIVRGLRAVIDADLADVGVLSRVTAPCLLVGGSADQFFGEAARIGGSRRAGAYAVRRR